VFEGENVVVRTGKDRMRTEKELNRLIALGDALASSVSEDKGFNRSDFHGFHPGGSLGNQLENE